tara:strand:+ start:14 stop:877 length:864 start_codon:yes stop_codon:yes gene_type:complete
MPELPEVEVVKKSLRSLILNHVIRKVQINTSKLRYIIEKKSFKKIIKKKIVSINRKSKYLVFNLSGDTSILAHLGMTGKFIVVENKIKRKTSFYYNLTQKDEKHNHVIFFLNKGKRLIFNDIRKFGFIKILKSKNIDKIIHFKNLGPEPLSSKFNKDYFFNYIINKNKSIKDLLMDQKFISGLGNIYVNEIIHLSKIKPIKKINKIKKIEIERIVYFTKKILKKSIHDGGSSIRNFENSDGKIGSFQQNFYVYGREGKNCLKLNCNGSIKRINQSNRSTFYCEICQK